MHRYVETELAGASSRLTTVETSQQTAGDRMNRMDEVVDKNWELTQLNRQRESKGNFVISGEGIPISTPNENLYQIMSNCVHQKYGVWIHWEELRVLHRLPGNKILFSLFSRMPGTSYEKLINQMNSNPHPHIKVYVSIQLFEPFSQHYYLARRLKQLKIISNYRLDENGTTHVAFSQEHRTFRFEGLEQLRKMQVTIPESLVSEMMRRKETEQAWEEGKHARNLKNAFERRSGENRRQQQYDQQGRKRQISSNSSPAMGKRPPMKDTPPNRGSSSLFHPVQHQSSAHSSEVAPTNTQVAAAAAQPGGAAGYGQPGAGGYYHQQFYNGAPVTADYGPQLFYRQEPGW